MRTILAQIINIFIFPFPVTRRYHRSDWLSRLNQGGALLAIGSEEKPLLLTENAERLMVRNLPYFVFLFTNPEHWVPNPCRT